MDILSTESDDVEDPLLESNRKKLNTLTVIKFCWTEFNNNSDLLSALLILIIDIIFFVGK